jgi:FAD-dependent monooxygenase
VVEFLESNSADVGSGLPIQAAETLHMRLKHILLQNQDHAHDIWDKRLVLIRPDGHVSWREDSIRFGSGTFKIVEVPIGLYYCENMSKTEDVDLEKRRFAMAMEMHM